MLKGFERYIEKGESINDIFTFIVLNKSDLDHVETIIEEDEATITFSIRKKKETEVINYEQSLEDIY